MIRVATLAALAIAASVLLGCGWVDFYALLGDNDARFLQCGLDVMRAYDALQEDMEQAAARGDVHELCYKLTEWKAELGEQSSALHGCPEPTDPHLVAAQAYVVEMLDEETLLFELLTLCCENEDCDWRRIDSQADHVGDLLDSAVQEFGKYDETAE